MRQIVDPPAVASRMRRPSLARAETAERRRNLRRPAESAVDKPSALLALFFVSILVPGTLVVGGLELSMSRLLLLVCFVPLALRWLSGRAGGLTGVDVLIALHCVWIGVALMAVHGPARIPFAGITAVEMLGGYLMGRILVRGAADYAAFVRYMFVGLLIMLPFAVIELFTGRSIVREVFGLVLNMEDRAANSVPRLGFQDRVQGPFGHSILFGLFCSLGVANFFYVYRDALVKRLSRVGLAVFMTMISLSSAPLLSAGIQIMSVAWDQAAGFLRARWKILVVLAATSFAALQTLTPNGAIDFVISNFTFVPETGLYRLYTFQYGVAEVLRHPFFGIGLNDWERAYWMYHASVDNFWLLTAMRYGLPGVFFLLFGVALHFWRASAARDLDFQAASFRTGYLIASLGLFMTLVTVHIWGALATFVMAYIGAGSWFYAAPKRAEDARERGPRRTRALAERRERAPGRRPGPDGRHRPERVPGASPARRPHA